jgi:hypothetical protein
MVDCRLPEEQEKVKVVLVHSNLVAAFHRIDAVFFARKEEN